MIAMIDYGAGNIRSVAKALEKVGGDVHVTEDPEVVLKADKVVLPGVGHYGNAMQALEVRNMLPAIHKTVEDGKPFFGICVGLQCMFESSEEDPGVEGLSLLKGEVVRFTHDLKVPHLGWNQVLQKTSSPLWKDIPDGSYFYFAHSFYVKPTEDITIGQTDYGMDYTSTVQKKNIFGIQFHPEKSQKWGLTVLKNFVEL